MWKVQPEALKGALICITNRTLCQNDFLQRIKETAAQHPAAVVLREKDVPEAQYRALAEPVLALCRAQNVPCILHTFVPVALALEPDGFHAPLPVLRQMTEAQKARFPQLGTSCHSPEDVQLAQELGCTYVFAGHIFDTDCKKGLPGRGLSFLQAACQQTSLPVYAIGGIDAQRLPAVRQTGAAGACVMSGGMQCPDPTAYWSALKDAWDHSTDISEREIL